jgi:hypothetical protein
MTGFSRFEKGICMIFWHSSIFSGLSTSAYLKKARIAASLWLRVEMLFPRSFFSHERKSCIISGEKSDMPRLSAFNP